MLITTGIECFSVVAEWQKNKSKEGLVIEHKFPQWTCNIMSALKNQKLEQI